MMYQYFDIYLIIVIGSPAAQSQDIIGRYLGEDPASELHVSAILR